MIEHDHVTVNEHKAFDSTYGRNAATVQLITYTWVLAGLPKLALAMTSPRRRGRGLSRPVYNPLTTDVSRLQVGGRTRIHEVVIIMRSRFQSPSCLVCWSGYPLSRVPCRGISSRPSTASCSAWPAKMVDLGPHQLFCVDETTFYKRSGWSMAVCGPIAALEGLSVWLIESVKTWSGCFTCIHKDAHWDFAVGNETLKIPFSRLRRGKFALMSLSLQWRMTCFTVWCSHRRWQAREVVPRTHCL